MRYLPKFRRLRAKPLRPTIREIEAAWAQFDKDEDEARAAAQASKKAARRAKSKRKSTRNRLAKNARIIIISSAKTQGD